KRVFATVTQQKIERDVGYAILSAEGYETNDEVVFAEPGDMSLLGVRTLEGFGRNGRQCRPSVRGNDHHGRRNPPLEAGAVCERGEVNMASGRPLRLLVLPTPVFAERAQARKTFPVLLPICGLFAADNIVGMTHRKTFDMVLLCLAMFKREHTLTKLEGSL